MHAAHRTADFKRKIVPAVIGGIDSTIALDVPCHYRNFKLIGSGAYGRVFAAYDEENNRAVAIKKLEKTFQVTPAEPPMRAVRAWREIKLLQDLRGHNNILRLFEVFTPGRVSAELDDVYFVTELMEMDLGRAIHNKVIQHSDVKPVIYNVLRGLKFIHSAGVIHRDLKPQNVAISRDAHGDIEMVKILDFGLARPSSEKMSVYVVTRYYRAPELLWQCYDTISEELDDFRNAKYGAAVDVWSVACIMAEMITGKILLEGRGTDFRSQIRVIISALGAPPKSALDMMNRSSQKFIADNLHSTSPNLLRQRVAPATEHELDLITRMLDWTPLQRVSVRDALSIEYFAGLHDPRSPEPTREEPVKWDVDDSSLSLADLKELIFKEMQTIPSE